VARTAARLGEICRGEERIALWLPNGVDLVTLLWASLRAGRVACLLSTRTPPAQVADQLNHLGARTLVTTAARHERLSGLLKTPVQVIHPGVVIQETPNPETSNVVFRPEQPASVLFTSGSTGTPKAAQHSVGNHYYSALGSNQNIVVQPGDRWLLALPLYHVGGLGILWRCWLGGATVVIPPSQAPLADVLRAQLITHLSLVPTQLRRLLEAQPTAPPSTKAVLLGGSAIPPELLDRATASGWPVHTTYGMTEMTSQVTTTSPGASREQLRSAGRVLPHRELRIADDGEILVRGPTLFQGYLTPDGALDQAVDAEGWYHTRDLGRCGPDGLLYVVGRKDHLFISGGENIQPEEIEALLVEQPGVTRAVVVPVPDAEYGERPVAFVDGIRPERLEQLADELDGRLPRFKIPDAFYAWPADGTEGMKVDRTQLQRLARARRRR
jgi:O-succinylbenzoic acid--CoA ligase